MVKINKLKLNLTIDIIMFIVLMAIAGIGFMIKYVLVPGYKRNAIYGSDVELYFGGLDRHEWGSIHLIISFGLLFLLLLHIIFHWKQIVCILKNMVRVKSWRVAFTILFIGVSILLGVMPLFIKPEVQPGEFHHYHREGNTVENNIANEFPGVHQEAFSGEKSALAKSKPVVAEHEHINSHTAEVHGKMTLNEVALKYKIPVEELARFIGVPETSLNEKLGRLRKRYDFQMEELRDFIDSKITK